MMNARELAEALADGATPKKYAGQWMVPCPAHNDNTPSCSVADGNNGPVIKCFAGCDNNDIIAARNLTWADILGDESNQSTDSDQTVYRYHDKNGIATFEVVRGPGKRFRQRQPDRSSKGGYIWNLQGVDRVLYHLPDVMGAVREGSEVWVTEGEKDADAVRGAGVCATTMPGGVGKWRDEYTDVLADATVTIWADADEPGRVHARNLRETLLPVVAQVRVVESAHGKDAYDHLGWGLGLDDVLVTVPYEQPEAESLFLLVDEYIAKDRPIDTWVIPTVMRHNEVMVLTGFEGMGKSSMMKQFAVAAAIGVHPIHTARTQEPCRVLYIDCENNANDISDDFARLRDAARADGTYPENPVLFVHDRLDLNLEKQADFAWLVERVNAHQPDLLLIGPVYGLIGSDMKNEEAVRALRHAITAAQQTSSCAVILEHHSPHKAVGEERGVRPYGSSLLMRWPSFGFGLRPTGGDVNEPFEFAPWRGSRRRGRSWPQYVQQAKNGWFWEECEPLA